MSHGKKTVAQVLLLGVLLVRFRYGFGEGKDKQEAADKLPQNDNTHSGGTKP